MRPPALFGCFLTMMPMGWTLRYRLPSRKSIPRIGGNEPRTIRQAFGKDVVTSEKNWRKRSRKMRNDNFVQQSDQKLLNDVVKPWFQTLNSNCPPISEALDQINRWIQVYWRRSQCRIHPQWKRVAIPIDWRQIARWKRSLTNYFRRIKGLHPRNDQNQMAQYGHLNPTDDEVEGIVARIMGNEEEVRRLTEQLNTQKNCCNFLRNMPNWRPRKLLTTNSSKEAYA